jgi:pyruvate/2-oxoglutarate dehydrogenase complex dihydrolipoamide dehydrogenase (E3) component
VTVRHVAKRDVRADIVVLGAGSATSSFVSALEGSPTVVVFEPSLVGGDCPYDACIPSKSLLHDGAVGRAWSTASRRRLELIDHRDDERHAAALSNAGDVEIVREQASIIDEHRVSSDSVVVTADHVVLATGAAPVVPDIDGLADVGDLVWHSADALSAAARPGRLAVAGGGVIGCELTRMFTSFGSDVTLFEPNAEMFGALHPDVSASIERAMRSTGADIRLGVTPTAVSRHGDRVSLVDDRGDTHHFDRLLLAVGRRPDLDGIGLEALGLSTATPLPVDDTGRVRCSGSVWAIGDVAGREQYTHAANHHGRVVANQITGSADRRFGDVVSAACMFVDPPMMTVGPTHADTVDDPDIAWFAVDVAESTARAATDERTGALAVAVDRTTRCLVAAHGIGPCFDELVHALIIAIDGSVPVDRLVQSMYPFPTMGDALRAALSGARDAISG